MILSLSIFATTLFLLAILFLLKHYERTRSVRLFGDKRIQADRVIVAAAAALEDRLPHASRELSRQTTHTAVYHTSAFALVGVRFLERRLSAFTDMIRGRGVKPERSTASFYLKDIAEHKRQNGVDRSTLS